jgi:hypothetical protein
MSLSIGLGLSSLRGLFGGEVSESDVWNFSVEVFDASTETWNIEF